VSSRDKALMPRDPKKVAESVRVELLRYLEDSSEHGGRRVGEIFVRAQTITGFSTDILLDASNMGYLTLFMYEVMHEKVCLKYRAETAGEDPSRIMVDLNVIRNEHTNTLTQLVARWKPKVGPETVSGMKVIHQLICLLTMLDWCRRVAPFVDEIHPSCSREGKY
jgi:hypothetical protein